MKVINLPPNWSITKLVDICDKVSKVKSNDYEKKEEFLYLDIGCINNKRNKIETIKKYKWENAPSRAKQIVRGGDILFSTVRTYLKNVAMVPEIYDGQIASTGFCVIRPKKDVLLSNYIFNLLIYNKFLENLNILQTGSSYPAVRDRDVYNQFIPLPPLPTQHRIVEKIEELFSELDSGVGSLKKAKEQIGLYKQSVLRAAFSGELVKREKANVKRHRAESRGRQTEVLKAAEPGGEYEVDGLPVGWKWVKLEDISEKIHYGYTAKSSENFNGPKYLRITDIQEGKVDWKKVPHCNIEDDQIGKYKLNNGDIVFARTGATVGKSFLIKSIPYESVFASYLIRVIPSDEVLNEYIYYFFQSNKYWEQIKRGQVGIGQPNFNGKKLSQINIPIPPLDQQHQIVAEIERRFSEAENLEKSIDEGLAKAEALRQSILKQAFEGRLVS